MLLGYNTNGLANQDWEAMLALLADIGYQSIALTLDRGSLDPFAPDWAAQLRAIKQRLTRLNLTSVVETGARFLLDPAGKHEPTLLTADAALRQRRVMFLQRAIDAAAELGSDCVSLWSGAARAADEEETLWGRLVEGLTAVLDHAERREVNVGFEPEPGMFVDTMGRYAELHKRLPHPRLKLTLDIGHLHCQGETPIARYVRDWAAPLINVHLEDMRAGVHEHLMFGEGEIDFPPVLAALSESGYRGGLHVELSRHAHEGPAAALGAYQFLRPLVDRATEPSREISG